MPSTRCVDTQSALSATFVCVCNDGMPASLGELLDEVEQVFQSVYAAGAHVLFKALFVKPYK